MIQNTPQKLIIKGATGSGKSTMLLDMYKRMVGELHLPSEKILILLMNRTQSLSWRSKTMLEGSGAIWRTSYYGFVQQELKSHYPTVLKNCKELEKQRIQPVFLTFESAQYLVAKVIDSKRKNIGLLDGLTSNSDKVAMDLASNLVRSAISGIPYQDAGKRLYDSLEIKNSVKKQVFTEIDDIARAFKKKCETLGVLDFSMAVDLYNNCLLKDESYKQDLFKRVRYLVVDNIEECVPVEVDFIEMLLPSVEGCYLGYNHEGGYGKSFGGDRLYAEKRIIENAGKHGLEVLELGNPYTCSDCLSEFSDMLFDGISGTPALKKSDSKAAFIERHPSFELRSEMLEGIGQRIVELIAHEGYEPSDIAIISTYADPVTEFVIGRILERSGIILKNFARSGRMIDNPFSQALVTLAKLCHPSYAMAPTQDAVKSLIRLLLKIDPVRSSILAGEVCKAKPFAKFPDVEFPGLVERIGYYNVEKYQYIREWIDRYITQGEMLPISEFLQKVLLEVLISKEMTVQDISKAKSLIDSAQIFLETTSNFSKNASRDFLDLTTKGVKLGETISELEEKLSGNFVALATSVVYLSSSMNKKVVILAGASSSHWSPRNLKEITNINVLSKSWDESGVYTDAIEQENQENYLATIMRMIIKRCRERLITFESDLSAGGYENNGKLSEVLDKLMN